jgi:hypothetical protein
VLVRVTCQSHIRGRNKQKKKRLLARLQNQNKFLQEKAAETSKQKEENRTKPHMPKPEEQKGMPQHHHCPHAKRREDI